MVTVTLTVCCNLAVFIAILLNFAVIPLYQWSICSAISGCDNSDVMECCRYIYTVFAVTSICIGVMLILNFVYSDNCHGPMPA